MSEPARIFGYLFLDEGGIIVLIDVTMSNGYSLVYIVTGHPREYFYSLVR